MRFGLTKKRVLPEPEPPMTTMFLFRAYFGFLGLLLIVSFSVSVRMILFSGFSSMKGLMSAAVPHEAFCQVLFLFDAFTCLIKKDGSEKTRCQNIFKKVLLVTLRNDL